MRANRHARWKISSQGYERARRLVSPSNARALRYYARHGWIPLSKAAPVQKVLLMHKTLDRA